MSRRDRDHYLFMIQSLSGLIDACGQQLTKELSEISRDSLASSSEQQIQEQFEERFKLVPLRIKDDETEVDVSDTKIDVSHDTMRLFTSPGPHYVNGVRYTYYIPFDGDPDLLKYCPSTFSLRWPYAEVKNGNLIIEIDCENPDRDNPDSQMESELQLIKTFVSQVNEDIKPFNQSLSSRISNGINSRKEKVALSNSVQAGSKYKVRSNKQNPSSYSSTAIKRKSQLNVSQATSTPGQSPEPYITSAEYEHILDIIKHSTQSMERTPQTYKSMGEEEIRDILLTQLNGHYEGKAAGEAFNAAGKTDILVRDGDKNIFIGECKIWKGASVFTDAIDQLLSYASWKDTKTALIIFNRNKDTTSVINQIPDLVKSHTNFKRELTAKDEADLRFSMRHAGDQAKELFLSVIIIDVPA